MKKILAVLAVLVFVVGIPVSAYAINRTSDTEFRVEQDEVIDDDLFVAAESVTIEGIVNGDVYAAANRVTVRGTVNGDVFAAGSLIEVTGVVTEDVRVVGETVTISSSAKIGDSFSALGTNVNLSDDSTVGGGVLAAGANIDLNGNVGRGVLVGADKLSVGGQVNGDIKADVTKLSFSKNADVQGEVEYSSPNEAVISDGAQFTSQPELKEPVSISTGAIIVTQITSAVTGFTMAFATGAVLILLSKRHMKNIARSVQSKLPRTTGFGLLFIFSGIPIAILMMLTIVGIPLGVITLLVWGVALYLGKIFAGLAIGEWLLRKKNVSNKKYSPNTYAALAVGLVVVYIVNLVPVLNIFTVIGFTAAGLGGLVMEVQRTRKASHS